MNLQIELWIAFNRNKIEGGFSDVRLDRIGLAALSAYPKTAARLNVM